VRVNRSFAFIDLSGFTALTQTQGDERAVTILASFRASVRDVCSRRGVRIAKWLGDGAMLVGVDPTPLIAATLEIGRQSGSRSNPMSIRCGLTTGEVILLEGDDYVGHSVNLAARLCDVATGGQVLATTAIVPFLPPWATVVSTDPLVIRSLEAPIDVAQLALRPAGADAVADPICGIPLTEETAPEVLVDAVGLPVLFCSDSCRDTWQRRPAPIPEEQGSLRVPLIGT
jgi:class 3 adenylate cyclase